MKLMDIAKMIDAELVGDGEMLVYGISSLETTRPGTITFTDEMSLLKNVKDFSDIAIIVPRKPESYIGNFVIHPKPRVAFAKISAWLNPPYWLSYSGISPDAYIEDGAFIAEDVSVGAGAFVGEGAQLMENVRVLPLAYIGRKVVIGRGSVILPGAVILDGSKIGERVIINSNVVIGGEGFGFVEDGDKLLKVPQTGEVIIEDDVEIGAGTTVDRGTVDDTIIGAGTKIDNLVQIGHNVRIGKNVRIAAQAGLSGRVKVEDDVVIGGQAGFQNAVTIGKGVHIAGQAAIFKSIPAGQVVSGYPAMPHARALRILALTKRLPEIIERLDDLEKRLEGPLSERRKKGEKNNASEGENENT